MPAIEIDTLLWSRWIAEADAGRDAPSAAVVEALPEATRTLPLRWLSAAAPALARHATCLRIGSGLDAESILDRAIECGLAAGIRRLEVDDVSAEALSRFADATAQPPVVRIRHAHRTRWSALRGRLGGLELTAPTPEAAAALVEAPGCRALRSFVLEGGATAASLPLAPTVSALSVSHTAGVDVQALIGRCTGLRSLAVVGCAIGSLTHPERSLESLETLALWATRVAALPTLPALQVLRLRACDVHADDLNRQALAQLVDLELSGMRLKESALHRLVRRCERLTRLALPHQERIGRALADGGERLGGSLMALDVSGTDVEDAFVDALRRHHPSPRLERLNLAHTRISGRGLRCVLDGAWLGRLRELDVSGCRLDRVEGGPAASDQLQRLTLDRAYLTSDGAADWLSTTQLPRLRSLSATGVRMSEPLAVAIGSHTRGAHLLGLVSRYPRGASPAMFACMLPEPGALVALDVVGWQPDALDLDRLPHQLSLLRLDGTASVEALGRLLERLVHLSDLEIDPLRRQAAEVLVASRGPALERVWLGQKFGSDALDIVTATAGDPHPLVLAA